ncbi:helix-turn-helix domain-containing protein [Paenibacillus radicis (ex Gao et al. 2016)]|uniref:HTH-type transcriptional activator Btr n=1 Tax=Paenibacillus radicis (ex Gao et al. 2016) TaxID=1737354 RepID=A0A917LXD4_9BACL|nr:helix-turn-helix domain-containing protein [Paenibacillus radicis (ex Gao et al. 2016)]GGG65235.1 HTH-type transcriptional activator Btr [Paenibacillus radicis (ex Gao et al. 2016)]
MNAEQFLNDTMFELIQARKSGEPPDWAIGSLLLEHHTLLYLVKGDALVQVDGLEARLESDTLHVFAPGTRLELRQGLLGRLELCWLTFDIFRLTKHAQNNTSRSFIRETTFPLQGQIRASSHLFKRYFYLLEAEGKRMQAQNRFQAQQYLYDLLKGILQHAAPVAMNDIEERLKQAIHYMQNHYREEIRVDKLAELAGLHPTYFSQLFKRNLGKTPVSFLAHLRMNKAKEMLLQTDRSIREIAQDVGYSDEFYFSRRFKEMSGYSPTMFTSSKNVRIVSLSYPYTDHLLTLGIKPCAAQLHAYLPETPQSLRLPRHGSELWEISRETFAEAKPDLILCKDNVHGKALENVNDIAPVIAIPWTTKDIYAHLTTIAELVDRKQAAEAWITEHKSKAEQLHRKLEGKLAIADTTVAVCSARAKGLRMYGSRNIGHVFYRSLGFQPPQRIQEQLSLHPEGTGFNWTGIAPHEIGNYEADYLLVAVETDEDRERVQQWIVSEPAWAAHSAVKNGRVFVVDWDKWILYSPQMINWQLEEAYLLLSGEA